MVYCIFETKISFAQLESLSHGCKGWLSEVIASLLKLLTSLPLLKYAARDCLAWVVGAT